MPEKLPYRTGWWGSGMEAAGLGMQRPKLSTYALYPYDSLPALPFTFDGTFDWLSGQQPFPDGGNIFDNGMFAGVDARPNLQDGVAALVEACQRENISLPNAFLAFMNSPELPRRIRSCTACFLDFASRPERISSGHSIPFLMAGQFQLTWHLLIFDRGPGHVVICTQNIWRSRPLTEAEQQEFRMTYPETELPSEIDELQPSVSELTICCSPSFEEFMCRYWIENEIWYATHGRSPVGEIGQRYIEAYRSAPAFGG